MLGRLAIIRRAEQDGVDANVVERDYVLAHVVAQLHRARIQGGGQLLFKGGTALRFVHLREFRYSADLDFTVTGGGLAEGLRALGDVIDAARSEGGFPQLELDLRAKPSLLYRGPLGSERVRRIKIDVSDDEPVFHVEAGILHQDLWSDLPPPIPFAVYGAAEIATEKVRCIMQRIQCRDLYDLYRLVEDLDIELRELRPHFIHKAQHKGIDPFRFEEHFEHRLERYQRRWSSEMEVHLLAPPSFDEVARKMKRHFRQAGYFDR